MALRSDGHYRSKVPRQLSSEPELVDADSRLALVVYMLWVLWLWGLRVLQSLQLAQVVIVIVVVVVVVGMGMVLLLVVFG
jgi:hypothetical protein